MRTSRGTGTVVKVDGERYLVSLDRQAAQLWERVWDLKRTEAGHAKAQSPFAEDGQGQG